MTTLSMLASSIVLSLALYLQPYQGGCQSGNCAGFGPPPSVANSCLTGKSIYSDVSPVNPIFYGCRNGLWAISQSTVVGTGTTANTDTAFEVTLSHTTGLASYTTTKTYQVHPICSKPDAIASALIKSGLSEIGTAWSGSAGNTWTITYTAGSTSGLATDLPLDVVCIARN